MNLEREKTVVTPSAAGPNRLERAAQAERSMPHRLPAEDVVAALGSDALHGLSEAEAGRRLERYGPNRLKSAPDLPIRSPSR